MRPESCRKEILTRLAKEPLLDLSISRTTFAWGIPLPGAPKHVMCAGKRRPVPQRGASLPRPGAPGRLLTP